MKVLHKHGAGIIMGLKRILYINVLPSIMISSSDIRTIVNHGLYCLLFKHILYFLCGLP